MDTTPKLVTNRRYEGLIKVNRSKKESTDKESKILEQSGRNREQQQVKKERVKPIQVQGIQNSSFYRNQVMALLNSEIKLIQQFMPFDPTIVQIFDEQQLCTQRIPTSMITPSNRFYSGSSYFGSTVQQQLRILQCLVGVLDKHSRISQINDSDSVRYLQRYQQARDTNQSKADNTSRRDYKREVGADHRQDHYGCNIQAVSKAYRIMCRHSQGQDKDNRSKMKVEGIQHQQLCKLLKLKSRVILERLAIIALSITNIHDDSSGDGPNQLQLGKVLRDNRNCQIVVLGQMFNQHYDKIIQQTKSYKQLNFVFRIRLEFNNTTQNSKVSKKKHTNYRIQHIDSLISHHLCFKIQVKQLQYDHSKKRHHSDFNSDDTPHIATYIDKLIKYDYFFKQASINATIQYGLKMTISYGGHLWVDGQIVGDGGKQDGEGPSVWIQQTDVASVGQQQVIGLFRMLQYFHSLGIAVRNTEYVCLRVKLKQRQQQQKSKQQEPNVSSLIIFNNLSQCQHISLNDRQFVFAYDIGSLLRRVVDGGYKGKYIQAIYEIMNSAQQQIIISKFQLLANLNAQL